LLKNKAKASQLDTVVLHSFTVESAIRFEIGYLKVIRFNILPLSL